MSGTVAPASAGGDPRAQTQQPSRTLQVALGVIAMIGAVGAAYCLIASGGLSGNALLFIGGGGGGALVSLVSLVSLAVISRQPSAAPPASAPTTAASAPTTATPAPITAAATVETTPFDALAKLQEFQALGNGLQLSDVQELSDADFAALLVEAIDSTIEHHTIKVLVADPRFNLSSNTKIDFLTRAVGAVLAMRQEGAAERALRWLGPDVNKDHVSVYRIHPHLLAKRPNQWKLNFLKLFSSGEAADAELLTPLMGALMEGLEIPSSGGTDPATLLCIELRKWPALLPQPIFTSELWKNYGFLIAFLQNFTQEQRTAFTAAFRETFESTSPPNILGLHGQGSKFFRPLIVALDSRCQDEKFNGLREIMAMDDVAERIKALRAFSNLDDLSQSETFVQNVLLQPHLGVSFACDVLEALRDRATNMIHRGFQSGGSASAAAAAAAGSSPADHYTLLLEFLYRNIYLRHAFEEHSGLDQVARRFATSPHFEVPKDLRGDHFVDALKRVHGKDKAKTTPVLREPQEEGDEAVELIFASNPTFLLPYLDSKFAPKICREMRVDQSVQLLQAVPTESHDHLQHLLVPLLESIDFADERNQVVVDELCKLPAGLLGEAIFGSELWKKPRLLSKIMAGLSSDARTVFAKQLKRRLVPELIAEHGYPLKTFQRQLLVALDAEDQDAKFEGLRTIMKTGSRSRRFKDLQQFDYLAELADLGVFIKEIVAQPHLGCPFALDVLMALEDKAASMIQDAFHSQSASAGEEVDHFRSMLDLLRREADSGTHLLAAGDSSCKRFIALCKKFKASAHYSEAAKGLDMTKFEKFADAVQA